MSRTIRIDKDVRAWLESRAREGETHNDVLRRIIGLTPDRRIAPGDQDAADAPDGAPDTSAP